MGEFALTVTLTPGEGFLEHFKNFPEKMPIKQPTQRRSCINSKDIL